jgi:ribosome-associated toxin RatA of RatAB toxin-antitoxin module
MPHVIKSVLVPFSAEAMFDLVDDVAAYPQFLPWCSHVTLHARDAAETRATIGIRYLGVEQSFTTQNAKARPEHMTMRLVDGPFSALNGAWRFTPLSEDACKIEFSLDYTFSNRVVEQVIGPVMSMIAETFVDRFVARAEALEQRRSHLEP